MSVIWKWGITAAAILAAVTGIYFMSEGDSVKSKAEEKHSLHEAPHGSHENRPGDRSEIKASASYIEKTIQIRLKDQEGKPYDHLEISHEKLMHVIVVSEDLEQYRHIHPSKTGDGVYEAKQSLPDGSYKAFVDVKPKDSSYKVKPIPLKIGSSAEKKHDHLKPDERFVKKSSKFSAVMSPEKLSVHEPVTLAFSFDHGEPEPYLGAAGHVVILDEMGENYVHVHPKSQKETKFETEFDEPGIYKIWAEFKFEGKVHVFPYTVEVK
ncbi:hypothetical protein CEF21_12890 [Bacillus sp. FJAT-42376]|uniref:hypothetical protein n=1 Tax=Bacillus sp. FJAT-42376 TaxID=2014076 RepID=UPI000F4FC1E9|nr:hypothetical protein [Bacillus sp. FJAT-42376]AZB43129.1 hypothetical protein CEF21_12890 [Bacillus sp. FJAT-42376]